MATQRQLVLSVPGTSGSSGYKVPPRAVLVPISVFASFDGSGTAGTWIPGIRFISNSGQVIAQATAPSPVAAGVSADFSAAPFLGPPAAAGGGGGGGWGGRSGSALVWTAYTPTVTCPGGAAPGGSWAGAYVVLPGTGSPSNNDTIFFWFTLDFTSAGGPGVTYLMALPSQPLAGVQVFGSCRILDASTSTIYGGHLYEAGTTACLIVAEGADTTGRAGTPGRIDPTYPFAFANGDSIYGWGFYEDLGLL